MQLQKRSGAILRSKSKDIFFMANRVKRVCDVYTDCFSLLKAFEIYCAKCNIKCPMECLKIKDKKEHMRCFADWILSEYRTNVD